jgi:hypothetical protein
MLARSTRCWPECTKSPSREAVTVVIDVANRSWINMLIAAEDS